MEFKEISTLHKWYLKYVNRPAYIAYKKNRREHFDQQRASHQEALQEAMFIAASAKLHHVVPLNAHRSITRIKHSGNSGDIIYSLPAAFALAGGGKVSTLLHAHQPINNKRLYHPLGSVMLNERMIEMLRPLLLHQPQIEAVESFQGQPIDYDFDAFRNYSFHLDRGSIVRWYFLVYGVTYNTSLPWLQAPRNDAYSDRIVIARSHRYCSPVVDYSFLNDYPNKLFLGIEEEYKDMRKTLHKLEYHPVADFLEMATIINSCRFFIGNQSFPFSIAEGLKVQRLLEVHYLAPNVIVEGEGGNDFMYQPQFEYAVKRLYNSTSH